MRPWTVATALLCLSLAALPQATRADIPPIKMVLPKPRKTPKVEPEVKAMDALHPIGPTRPARLPDGVFAGPIEGLGSGHELELTVVNGLLVDAVVRRPDPTLPRFELRSIGPVNALGINLRAHAERDNLKISGEFFDPDRGQGTVEGVFGGKRVTGTWLIARR